MMSVQAPKTCFFMLSTTARFALEQCWGIPFMYRIPIRLLDNLAVVIFPRKLKFPPACVWNSRYNTVTLHENIRKMYGVRIAACR